MARVSSASAADLSLRDAAAIAVAAAVGMGAFVIASARTYRLGFPLDDSWIHATYSRNLALSGEWAFQLGQASAGSTSPLWTLLLTPGHWLGAAPLWWSHFLGLVALAGLGAVAEATIRRLSSGYRPRVPWVGIFIAFEWHMLWAAASGMETLLHAVLATILLSLLVTGCRNFAALGLLTGLSVWVRPDGLTLAGPVVVGIMLTALPAATRLRGLGSYLLGLGALLVPYLALNLSLSGNPMPNTFYAKQAEYAAWQARPVLNRIGLGLVQLSTGPLVLLWPGLAITAFKIARSRNVALGLALVWCAAYALMYVLRLPPYQHGRYLMPVMPTLLLMGILGFMDVLEACKRAARRWALAWAWQAGLVMLTAGFLVLGAGAYGKDVALIESEMVNTAIWVAERLPPQAVIAAHDIGALGYFDRHALIDLAGLVSPQVLPFIRDETRLAAFLDESGAEYLVAFPDLYPDLARSARQIHSSGGQFAPAAGEGNMTVYCWRCR